MSNTTPCELCSQDGGTVLFRNTALRVILVDDADYPGFCRVIWHDHIKEMTDLGTAQRSQLMDAVLVVESAVRKVMQPDKINLASLGNVVPHLHWHVIPRYRDDRHFPNPIWGAPKRDASAHIAHVPANWREQLGELITSALTA